LNAFAFVFGIVSTGVNLTGLRRAVPVMLQRREVRQFRRELAEVDVVVLAWQQSLCDGLSHEVPEMLPDVRRPRRRDHPRLAPDGGGESIA
jgi:hypothetical protein